MKTGDLTTKARRKFDDVMRALILGREIFPLPVPIRKPRTTADVAELRETHRVIRSQSKETLGYGYTVEWQTIETRRHGRNTIPVKLSFATAGDYLRYMDAVDEAERIRANADAICEKFPEAREWCAAHLAFLRKTPEIIANALTVIRYLQAHPAPGVYARQLPIAVPSKFIESERSLLDAFMQAHLPQCLVQQEGSFEERAGLLTKESLLEFRSLDPAIRSLPFRHGMATAHEINSKADYFAGFDSVLVVENHVPFLTLPDLPKTLAIMGNGFAVRRLRHLQWLTHKRVFYWGDIDLSGFAILAILRENCPHAIALMMDRSTFDHFQPYHKPHIAEQTISESQMARLNSGECSLVQHLQSKSGTRLEQEHIDFAYVKTTLETVVPV